MCKKTASPSQALTRQIPLFVTCGDIFPRNGGSLSSKGEPLAVHADFISLPRPLPLGEVDLRSKDGEGEPGKVQPDILNAKIHFLLHGRFIRRSTTYDKS